MDDYYSVIGPTGIMEVYDSCGNILIRVKIGPASLIGFSSSSSGENNLNPIVKQFLHKNYKGFCFLSNEGSLLISIDFWRYELDISKLLHWMFLNPVIVCSTFLILVNRLPKPGGGARSPPEMHCRGSADL